MKNLNLIPKELRATREGVLGGKLALVFQRFPWVRWVILVVGAVAALSFWSGNTVKRYHRQVQRLQRELKQVKDLGNQLKTQQQTVAVKRSETLAQREQLESRLKVLEAAQQPAAPVSSILKELVELLPPEVWMTKLELTDQTLKILGVSKDTQSIARLITILEESKRFSQTTFSYSQRVEEVREVPYTFEITTVPLAVRGGGA